MCFWYYLIVSPPSPLLAFICVECSAHSDCPTGSYCDDSPSCWSPCEDCDIFDDGIDGSCPSCGKLEGREGRKEGREGREGKQGRRKEGGKEGGKDILAWPTPPPSLPTPPPSGILEWGYGCWGSGRTRSTTDREKVIVWVYPRANCPASPLNQK